MKLSSIFIWFILPMVMLLSAALLVRITKRNHSPELPHQTDFGEPATTSDLLIDPYSDTAGRTADEPPINLIGKWAIESVSSAPVVPAEDWLEKPAIAHLQFRAHETEIFLEGYSGCNGFGAKVHVLNDRLQTPDLSITQRLCSSKALQNQEKRLMQILWSPEIWQSIRAYDAKRITVGTQKTGIIQLNKLQ